MGVDLGGALKRAVTPVDGTHDAVADELGWFLLKLPRRSDKYP